MKFEGNIVLKSDNNDNNITIYLLSTIDSFLTLITAAFDVNTEPFNTVIKVMNNAKKILHFCKEFKRKNNFSGFRTFYRCTRKSKCFLLPRKKTGICTKIAFL